MYVYKKKTTNDINEEDIKNAIQVINKTMTLRAAVSAYNRKPNTLFYRLKNYKNNKKKSYFVII